MIPICFVLDIDWKDVRKKWGNVSPATPKVNRFSGVRTKSENCHKNDAYKLLTKYGQKIVGGGWGNVRQFYFKFFFHSRELESKFIFQTNTRNPKPCA